LSLGASVRLLRSPNTEGQDARKPNQDKSLSGSAPFMAVYNAALQATKPEQIMALRGHMRRQRSPKRGSPTADAIMVWAKREPITRAQAALVAKSLGVSINEIMRGRQIADDPKSETEPNPKNR